MKQKGTIISTESATTSLERHLNIQSQVPVQPAHSIHISWVKGLNIRKSIE